jgi:hypothetical protein
MSDLRDAVGAHGEVLSVHFTLKGASKSTADALEALSAVTRSEAYATNGDFIYPISSSSRRPLP